MKVETARIVKMGKIFAALVALCASGCGGSGKDKLTLHPVRGVVTLDGQPVPGALVQFSPAAPVAPVEKGADAAGTSFAISDASGHFELQFDQNRKGAVAGVHRVTVSKLPEDDSEDKIRTRDPIPPKYNLQSKLSYEVKEGANTFNLELTSK